MLLQILMESAFKGVILDSAYQSPKGPFPRDVLWTSIMVAACPLATVVLSSAAAEKKQEENHFPLPLPFSLASSAPIGGT